MLEIKSQLGVFRLTSEEVGALVVMLRAAGEYQIAGVIHSAKMDGKRSITLAEEEPGREHAF